MLIFLTKKWNWLTFVLTSISLLTKAQTPFPAEAAVALVKPGHNSSTQIYTIYTSTNMTSATSFIAGESINFSPRDVNGIGLNAEDYLLYGIAYSDNNTPSNLADDAWLYRIGLDGVFVNLGVLPLTGNGLDLSSLGYGKLEYANFSAGTIYNGNYIYPTYALKASSMSKLFTAYMGGPLNLNADDIDIYIAQINNIAGLSATPSTPSSYYKLDFSHPQIKSAINGFLQDLNNNFNSAPAGSTFEQKMSRVSWSNGGFQDIDINPQNGLLYTYINYQDPTPEYSNVDVVGMAAVAAAPVSNISVVTPIGSVLNEEPHQELSGLAFDATGDHLYAIFTSGEYAEIDLTTGIVNILGISNLPTEPYTPGGTETQYHLRGDFARPVPDIVAPVRFGNIHAYFSNNSLIVQWETLSEVNNDHFNIETSTDGIHFNKVGTIVSKAHLISNATLTYEYSIGADILPAGLLSLSLLGGICLVGFKRKPIQLFIIGLIALSSLGLNACSKNDNITIPSNKAVYIRIAQVDIDGTTSYSKVIKVVTP